MSNIQTISELCAICEALVHIVEEQRKDPQPIHRPPGGLSLIHI